MCHDNCPRPISGGEAIDEQTVEIPLSAGTLPTIVTLPERQPAPVVLLIHDVNGVNDFYRDVARRLALAGYITALPDFFFRQGPLTDDRRETRTARMQALEQSTTLMDIESALIWLRHHDRSSGQVGSVGFCMGGTLVMLAASRDPAPAAAVAYYGFPHRERTPMAPLLPADEDEAANLQSPLLAFWGTEDSGVGMANVDRYEAQLERNGKEFEFVRYPGIGHGFLTFDPNAPSFRQSEDSWERMLRFLDERLVRSVAS
ncbi:MAG: dienelactone hydrolase family protein [Chloroflexota bacterium]|nr:dienelactone hydrolase family protein [Chloroflexota bacterium]